MLSYKNSVAFDCNFKIFENKTCNINKRKLNQQKKSLPDPFKIVLIDDDEVDIDLTCNLIENLPITNEIEVFTGPEEAFKYFNTSYTLNQKPFSGIILLDQNMPTFSGLEVLKELRKEPVTADTPVFILTHQQDDNLILESCRQYAQGFFTKPISGLELVTQICNIPNFGVQLINHNT